MKLSDPEQRIAYLEARVAALEAELERRSRLLRRLQAELPDAELLLLSRIESGGPLPGRRAYEPQLWSETTELTAAEVEPTLRDLWRSLTPTDEHGEPLEAPEVAPAESEAP